MSNVSNAGGEAILRKLGTSGGDGRGQSVGQVLVSSCNFLGGWFQTFFISTPGEVIQIDEHIFQMGWFNHHLVLI